MRIQANLPMSQSGARCPMQAKSKPERWSPVREFLLRIERAMAAAIPGTLEEMALREKPA